MKTWVGVALIALVFQAADSETRIEEYLQAHVTPRRDFQSVTSRTTAAAFSPDLCTGTHTASPAVSQARHER